MSVNYVICAACGETFSDCSPFVICSNCEEWICEDCTEEQTNKYGKVDSKSEEAYFYGDDSLVECEFCTKSIIRDSEIIDFLLNKLGMNINEVKKEIKNNVNTED